MTYTSNIDNVTSKAWGFNIQQAYVFSWIYSVPSWADSAIIDGVQFYFASKTKAIEDIPLLTDKVDTMYRHYKSFEDMGLILLKKVDGKDYISLTKKATVWGQKLGDSEINPSVGFGNKSELESENNPTYYTINTTRELDSESKDSVTKQPSKNGTEVKEKKNKRGAAKKPVDECYEGFVKMWCEQYPVLGFDAISGKKIKALIVKTKNYLKAGGKEPDKQHTESMFAYVLAYIKRDNHWCHGKDISTFETKYLSIVNEIKSGKRNTNQQSTREFVRNL